MKSQKVQNTIAAVAIIVVLIYTGITLFNTSGSRLQKKMESSVIEIAQSYGLKDVSVEFYPNDFHQIFVNASNFYGMDWAKVFEMAEKINKVQGVDGAAYVDESQPYYLDAANNKITSYTTKDDIEFEGAWENVTVTERTGLTEEELEMRRKEKISLAKCGICGEQATEEVNDEYYCDKHYKDALEWYVKQALED